MQAAPPPHTVEGRFVYREVIVKTYKQIMEQAYQTARVELKGALEQCSPNQQGRFILWYGHGGDSLDDAISRVSEDRMSSVMQQIKRTLELNAQ